MSDISTWDPVAGNNDAAPPDGAPEGATLVADLNDIIRENMAATRRWYDNPSYRDLGHTLVSNAATNQIELEGDVQSAYAVNQPIEWDDAGGTKQGYITVIELVATNTILTVEQTNDADLTSPDTDPVEPDVTALRVGIRIDDYDQKYIAPVATAVAAFTSGGAGKTENLPATMTYEKLGAGRYKLTHNIGDRDYIPILTSEGGTGRMITYSLPYNNSFEVHIRDKDGVYDSNDHSVIVMRF